MAKPHQSFTPRERNEARRRANSRGVFAIRRPIHEDSFEVFEEINERLTPRFRGTDRLFTKKTITVTVIGFSRFNNDHWDEGPATSSIMSKVPSLKETIPVALGKLGVFGIRNNHKLAFELLPHNLDGSQPQLHDEITACEDAYTEAGFALEPDGFSNSGYVPHCSIGSLHRSNVVEHRKKQVLDQYDRVASALGSIIWLAPPRRAQELFSE